jgi:hypothetical protein
MTSGKQGLGFCGRKFCDFADFTQQTDAHRIRKQSGTCSAYAGHSGQATKSAWVLQASAQSIAVGLLLSLGVDACHVLPGAPDRPLASQCKHQPGCRGCCQHTRPLRMPAHPHTHGCQKTVRLLHASIAAGWSKQQHSNRLVPLKLCIAGAAPPDFNSNHARGDAACHDGTATCSR